MVHSGRSKAEIASWLTREIARRLNVDEAAVDPRASFLDYGLDSANAVVITEALAIWLGRDFPFMLLFEHQTIDSVAEHLSAHGS